MKITLNNDLIVVGETAFYLASGGGCDEINNIFIRPDMVLDMTDFSFEDSYILVWYASETQHLRVKVNKDRIKYIQYE